MRLTRGAGLVPAPLCSARHPALIGSSFLADRSPMSSNKRMFVFAVLALALMAFGAPMALGAPAEYAGSSADGSKVFFTTTAKLVPGDTDNGFRDVYERFEDT